MTRLPHVSGSKRGPKRIAKARKIASDARKNWHARASMWLDGVGAKKVRGLGRVTRSVDSDGQWTVVF